MTLQQIFFLFNAHILNTKRVVFKLGVQRHPIMLANAWIISSG